MGRFDVGNTFSLVLKEVLVGSILGLLYGTLIGFASESITGTQIDNLGLVIGLSIACSMTIATAVGASVPLILKKLSLNPKINDEFLSSNQNISDYINEIVRSLMKLVKRNLK